MRVLVTGSRGFVGRNLVVRLRELPDVDVLEFHRGVQPEDLPGLVRTVDVVFHLAGVNRPQNPDAFRKVNVMLTAAVLAAAAQAGRKIPIVFTSSTQADLGNPYGCSKLEAEQLVLDYAHLQGCGCRIYRLPNVFGKWSRPHYNSVVATFCHNVVHGLPLSIHDPTAELRLVYIDDLCDDLMTALPSSNGMLISKEAVYRAVRPVYETTVGELAAVIQGFGRARGTRAVAQVGKGFKRALYATYLSFIPPEDFSYSLLRHVDKRGEFAEFIRTETSGQFSYFTVSPGATRGGHYHHTKNEKFVVVRGHALFRFQNLSTDQEVSLEVTGAEPRVVETVPGWAHDITNIGEEEVVVMLWANEAFDSSRPDTIARALG